MKNLEPANQINLYGLNRYITELIQLDKDKILPNKILLSGQKGLGKTTLAYHFINYILSKNEEFPYNIQKYEINNLNQSFKTIQNKSNPNLITIDINPEKKFIDINQIRELIINLSKSCFNNKPRFILIDNIEFLNINSVNALLKILEEPAANVYFILINNNKKVLQTLSSRCLNFKIFLNNAESLMVSEKLLDNNLYQLINKDLINYYATPGNIYNLMKFANINKYNFKNFNVGEFLKVIIKNNHYKKNDLIKYLIFDFIEFYFRKIDLAYPSKIYEKYSYFLKRIADTKRFNLDEESLFLEFEEEILNG